ncbi:hypothetical protein ACHAQJ_000813 [Trichoderma viride]
MSTATRSNMSSFFETGGSGVYYVHFNPSSLSTLASATGKLIPYFSSAVTGLAAFFAADSIRKMSLKEQNDELLTPKQMSLLLGLLFNGWTGLWDSICYRVKRGSKFNGPLVGVVATLTFTTILGLIIPAIDTWFGLVVIPQEKIQLQAISSPSHSFGRGLISSDCTKKDPESPCDIVFMAPENYLVSNTEAFKVLNNVSTSNTVYQFPPNLSQKTMLFLGDTASSSNLDFKASTFAVTTQCEPITYNCTHDYPTFPKFNCTPALNSDFDTLPSPTGMKVFTNSSLTDAPNFTYQNPIYFATWAIREQANSSGLYTDPGVVFDPSVIGAVTWILNCSSTVYEADYTWVNGSVVSLNTTLANGTIGGIISGPFSNDHADAALQVAANLASISNTSAEIAATTAAYISHIALSLSIGAISSRTNLLEQSRSTVLLTRVPIVPFYILIALKLFYVLGVMLFALAVITLAHPAESAGVKAQITIDGLMAAIFGQDKLKSQGALESADELEGQGESEAIQDGPEVAQNGGTKVAIVKTEKGEWSYAAVITRDGKAEVRLV